MGWEKCKPQGYYKVIHRFRRLVSIQIGNFNSLLFSLSVFLSLMLLFPIIEPNFKCQLEH